MKYKIGDKVYADWEDGEGVIVEIDSSYSKFLTYRVQFPHGIKDVYEGELSLADNGELF